MHAHPAIALAAAIGRPDAHAGEVPVVYVQLHDGAAADESSLMKFASEHITERAARPKAVHIAEALPVTPVGKIFKPALVMQEITNVVRETADKHGIPLISVQVVQSQQHGLLAQIAVAGEHQNALSQALGAYTFAMEFASA